MTATLYALPISHPCMSAQLMLEHKGLDFERIDLMAGPHMVLLRAKGFERDYTPALVVDGERFQGTREISRALDRLRPAPPLFPPDADRGRAVEVAERFGEEVVQMLARRLAITTGRLARATIDFSYGATVGRRAQLALRMPGVWRALTLRYGATNAVTRADLIALPAILDRLDAWIEEGVLGGDEPNAADFQLAPSLQLMLAIPDVARAVEGRPVATLARLAPPYPRPLPSSFPEHWLEPLRAGVKPAPARS